jgi:hypothetical protein
MSGSGKAAERNGCRRNGCQRSGSRAERLPSGTALSGAALSGAAPERTPPSGTSPRVSRRRGTRMGGKTLSHLSRAAARTRGVAAGRSAQREARSSDWRRGAAGSPDPENSSSPDPENLSRALPPPGIPTVRPETGPGAPDPEYLSRAGSQDPRSPYAARPGSLSARAPTIPEVPTRPAPGNRTFSIKPSQSPARAAR